MVALVLLEPDTGVGVQAGLAGVASAAAITVLAMVVLSAGVQRTGIVQRPGRRITGTRVTAKPDRSPPRWAAAAPTRVSSRW